MLILASLPAAILNLRSKSEMALISSSVKSKVELSRFSFRRWGLELLGMTVMPRWVAQRRRTCAVVALCLAAMSATVSRVSREGRVLDAGWSSSIHLDCQLSYEATLPQVTYDWGPNEL